MKKAMFLAFVIIQCQFANAKSECTVELPSDCQYIQSHFEILNNKVVIQVDCNYAGSRIEKHIAAFDLGLLSGWTKRQREVSPDKISFISGSQQIPTVNCQLK